MTRGVKKSTVGFNFDADVKTRPHVTQRETQLAVFQRGRGLRGTWRTLRHREPYRAGPLDPSRHLQTLLRHGHDVLPIRRARVFAALYELVVRRGGGACALRHGLGHCATFIGIDLMATLCNDVSLNAPSTSTSKTALFPWHWPITKHHSTLVLMQRSVKRRCIK